jgi:hypothetical protein
LSKEPLKKPVVGDKLGYLYNKESLIKAMLEKRIPSSYAHISSLKDVKDLNILMKDGKIVCPITMMEFSGINLFSFLWRCGCVISKKAIDELNLKDKCIQCGAEVKNKNELISLNYTKLEREAILKRVIEEKKKLKEKKNNLKEEELKDKLNSSNNNNILLGKKRECKDDNINNIDKVNNINTTHNVFSNYKISDDGDFNINKIHPILKKRRIEEEILLDKHIQEI